MYALSIQNDQMIVVAGSTRDGIDTDFALARYDSDGLLDPGFGITKGPVKLAGNIMYQKFKDLDVKKNGVTGVTWVDQESYTVEGSALAAGVSMTVSW